MDFCITFRFIRCSWAHKFSLIKTLCACAGSSLVPKTVAQCTEQIFTKDVAESLSNNPTEYPYDKILIDSDRALEPEKLTNAMKKVTDWFDTLNSTQQVCVILKLLRLGGGGLIFNIYNMICNVYNFPKPETPIKPVKGLKTSTRTLVKMSDSVSKTRYGSKISKQSLDQVSNGSKEGDYTNMKLEALARRDSEILKYKKSKGLFLGESTSLLLKKGGEVKDFREVVDYLQILPISVNRRIMSYIDEKTLSACKKVGKYWVKMIDESINEKSGRKAINAKINKIIGTKPNKRKERSSETAEERREGGGDGGGERGEEFRAVAELGSKELANKKNITEVECQIRLSYISLL